MRGIFRGGVFIVFLCCCKIAAALEPTVKINIETQQRPVVNGQTNLPDGTDLMISMTRKESNHSAEDKGRGRRGKVPYAEIQSEGE
jgi:hypothetical protein